MAENETLTLEAAQESLRIANEAYDAELKKYEGATVIPAAAMKTLEEMEQRVITVQGDVTKIQEDSAAAKGLFDRHAQRQQQLRDTPTQTFAYGAAPQGMPRNATEARNMALAAAKTVGQQFVESQEFAAFCAQFGSKRGERFEFSEQGVIGSSKQLVFPASAKTLAMQGAMKSLITGLSDTSAGAFVRTQYYPNVDLPRRPLMLMDMVTNLDTTTDLVEYVRFTSRTNNAAATAEATTTSNGTKPESALALAKVQETVKTIAHWIPVTRRALSDAPQIRGIIDEELTDGVLQAVETEMITGDGTGEHFTGIETISGVGTQTFATDIKTTIRKARTKAAKTPAYILGSGAGRTNPRNVIILMNPSDLETVDLDQDNEARFYTGGPVQVYAPVLWGLPIVEHEGVTAGTAWVLDAKTLILWNREETSIRVSDSHANYFIQNMLAVLAEARYAFGCKRPSAIIEATLA